MNYYFHPAAEAEFLELVGYYESKISGLGGALIEEFEALAKLIGTSSKGGRSSWSQISSSALSPISVIHHLPPES
jgi:hypothetical protein